MNKINPDLVKKYPQKKIIVPRFKEELGFYTTRKRSELMSRIKGKNTKPEQKLRHLLWNIGIRYRKNVKTLPGSPDIVIKKYRLVIFIDGEFWHGFNWNEKKKKIKSNRDFWIPKIERTMQRDKENTEKLIRDGWTVFRFWADQVNKELGACLHKILQHIESIEE